MKQILVVLLVVLAWGCSQKKEFISFKMIPVKQGDYWGYIDKDGKLAVNPQFKRAFTFSEGLALIENTEGKYGYIDEQGKIVISPVYQEALAFSEGLAAVVYENQKITYIDKSGKVVITLDENTETAQDFHEGLALVEVNGKKSFIDNTGKKVFDAPYEIVDGFNEGIAVIGMKIKDATKYGYIDKAGKIIINPQYEDASPFNEKMAAVKLDKKFGFIDNTGKIVITPQFDEVEIFTQGVAAVKQGELWGFIDKSGKFAINPQFKTVSIFTGSGLCSVKSTSNDKWGFIDKEGKIKIEPQYEDVTPFFDDLSVTKLDKKYGVIGKDGKYVVNPTYDDYQMYSQSFSVHVTSDYFSIGPVVTTLFKDMDATTVRGISKASNFYRLQDKFPDLTHDNYSHYYGFAKDENIALELTEIDFSFNDGFVQIALDGTKTYNDFTNIKTASFIYSLKNKARDKSAEIIKDLKDKWPGHFTVEIPDSNSYILNSNEITLGITQKDDKLTLVVAFDKYALDFMRPFKPIIPATPDPTPATDSARKM